MSTTEWLGVGGGVLAILGWIEFRMSRQDDKRHALRNELAKVIGDIDNELSDQGKQLAKVWNKLFGNGQH